MPAGHLPATCQALGLTLRAPMGIIVSLHNKPTPLHSEYTNIPYEPKTTVPSGHPVLGKHQNYQKSRSVATTAINKSLQTTKPLLDTNPCHMT